MKRPCLLFQVFVLLILGTAAAPVVTKLDDSERWRQSVAVRLTTRGPDRPFDVLRTRRDSSVTVTFKRAVSNVLNATEKCKLSREKRCMLASNSPGLVGRTHYEFADASRKIQGHSTQVFLACRCLDYGCREAMVLEPRQVKSEDGKQSELEINVDDVHSIPDSTDFSVELGPNNFWRAIGRRRYIRDISRSELDRLEEVIFEDILEDFKKKVNASSTGEFYVFGNDTAGDYQFPDKSAVEVGDSEDCAKLFDFAQRSADWMGAQQDQLAIARNEDSFIVPRPEEPSSSDAFLAIGTGLTGLFASIGIWTHFGPYMRVAGQRKPSKWMTLWEVFKALLAVFVIGVEVATLAFSWVTQNEAEGWSSFFTWFDASVALSPSVRDCESSEQFVCSAARSVYVVAGLMGTATAFHPNRTRWKALLTSMVLIIAASLVFVCSFFVKSYRSWTQNGLYGSYWWTGEAYPTTLLVKLNKRDRRRIHKSHGLLRVRLDTVLTNHSTVPRSWSDSGRSR